MAKEMHSLDVDTSSEVARLARRVRTLNHPLYLTEAGETVAVLMPVRRRMRRARKRPFTAEDDAAFLASAGAWKDVDVEGFLLDNAESRRMSTKPPPEL